MKITRRELAKIILETLNEGEAYKLFGQEFKSKNPTVDVNLVSALDRFFGQPVMGKPKVIYHGTTRQYIDELLEKNPEALMHTEIGDSGTDQKEIWLAASLGEALSWANTYAGRYKGTPVVVVVDAGRLEDLRRSHFGSGLLAYAWRADLLPRDIFKVIDIEYKKGSVMATDLKGQDTGFGSFMARTFKPDLNVQDLTDETKAKLSAAHKELGLNIVISENVELTDTQLRKIIREVFAANFV